VKTVVTHEQGLASIAAAVLNLKPDAYDRNVANWIIPIRAEVGDFSPLIAQARKELSPESAEVIVGLTKGKYRRPGHRTHNPQIYQRNLEIVDFICKRVDEGVPPAKAKAAAAQKFKVSKRTVRRACDMYRGKVIPGGCVKWPRNRYFLAAF